MHGNVEEVCRMSGGGAVARGGPHGSPALMCRSATRFPVPDDEVWAGRGFRVAIVGDLKARKEADKDGFVPLFNGKDLTGWKSDPVEKGRTWYVKDGLLGLKGSEKRTLFSERDDFRDFRLRIEAKYTAKAKPATVGLHAPYGVEDWGGVRCVGTGIGEDAGNVFVGFRHSTRTKAPRLEPGAWFTQEWIFKGTGLTVKLNGEELSTQDDVMEKLAQGHILFTLPPDNLVIRKIEIKEFGPSTGGDSK
jgi:hypothetical protein